MARKGRGLGEWAFILGVLLALLAGLASGFLAGLGLTEARVVTVLMVLGLLVGLLNVQEKETHVFLLAAIALMAIGAGGLDKLAGSLGTLLGSVVMHIVVFVAPAAFVVSLKAIMDMAKK